MKRVFIILLVLFLSSPPLFAKSPFDQLENSKLLYPPIKVSAVTNKSSVFPGEEFKFHLSIFVEEGWHIYSLQPFQGSEPLATQILMEKNNFQSQGDWKGTDPVLIKDGALGKIVKGYKGHIEFSKTYLVPINIAPQVYSLAGKIVFRACNNQICTLPRKFPFQKQITVVGH